MMKSIVIRFVWLSALLFIILFFYVNYEGLCAFFWTWNGYYIPAFKLLKRLLVCCYILLYFPPSKFKLFSIQLLYPLIAMIGIYLLHNSIAKYLDRPLSFSDLQRIPELFHFIPAHTILMFLYILIILLIPIFLARSTIKQYSKKYLFALVLIKIFLAYCVLFLSWTEYSVFIPFPWLEYLLLLFCYMILYFPCPNTRNFDIRLLYPLITIVGVYIFYEIMHSHLNRPLMFSDLQDIPTLYGLMPVHTIVMLVYMLLIFLIPLLFVLFVIKQYSKKYFFAVVLCKVILLSSFFTIVPSDFFFNLQQQDLKKKDVHSNNKVTVKRYGYILYSIYYQNRSKEITQQLQQKNHIDNYNILWKGGIAQFPNIHIIVLESFMNPYFIKDIDLNVNPIHPNIQKYLIDHQRFSIVKAPTYGGNTPRSEFELLTGTPALALLNGIEFNILERKPTSSFVNKMKSLGYCNKASIGSASTYYNKIKAYPSLGFDFVHFIDKDPYFYKRSDDMHIFDGDLLQANAKYIEEHINQSKQPIFNYVLGIYGHIPGHTNFKLRPPIVTVKNAPSSHRIQWVANDFYYRTQAVAEYLDYLQKIDPESIILVISDHLPPVLDNKIVYSKDFYENIAIFIVKGKVIDISGVHYYEIPRIIWGYLQHQDYNGKIEPLNDEILQDCYLKLMLEGITLPNK